MHRFLSKFIVTIVIVNMVIGIIAVGLSEMAFAQDITTTSDGAQRVKEDQFQRFCENWAAGKEFDYGSDAPVYYSGPSGTTYLYEGEEVTRSQLLASQQKKYRAQIEVCLNNPQWFVNTNLEKFDLNIILRRGKQVLPTETPRLINFPEIPGTENLDPAKGIPELIAFVYLIGLWLVGIAVFVQITGGGVTWLLSAGKPGEIEKAKAQITNAIFGLVLLLSSYVILNTINPDLINGIFDPPNIGVGGLPH